MVLPGVLKNKMTVWIVSIVFLVDATLIPKATFDVASRAAGLGSVLQIRADPQRTDEQRKKFFLIFI